MIRLSGFLPLVVVMALWSLPAGALNVDVELHGHYDLASYETWAWRVGIPAGGQLVEQIIRESLEAQMAEEGLTLVEGEADCYLSTIVITDNKFPAGVLKVNITDGESEQLAWQGILYGVLNTGKEAKIRKTFERAVRTMFKKFPYAIRYQ